MNKLNVFLEQLDLSEIEASLYTGLLDNGPMSVRDLAVFTKMKRTTAYFYIDQLIEKGLVVKLTRGTQKLVTVSMPKDSLQYLVEQKEKEAQEIKKEFPDILQAIKTTLPEIQPANEAEIKYFKGVNGIENIYEEALHATELRSYANFVSGAVLSKITDMFSDGFKKNPKLIMYEMLGDTPASRNQPSLHNERYFRKYIPNNVKLSTADTLIYDGKVCIINFENQVTGVVLQNTDYYRNTKELFDFLWKLLPAE